VEECTELRSTNTHSSVSAPHSTRPSISTPSVALVTVGDYIMCFHLPRLTRADPIEVPQGDPKLVDGWTVSTTMSSSKRQEVLGMQYHPIEETIRNTFVHALELGWRCYETRMNKICRRTLFCVGHAEPTKMCRVRSKYN
jgi:hypothetical protein